MESNNTRQQFQTNIKNSPFAQPLQKEELPLWREYWYVVAMAIAFIVLLLSYIIRLVIPARAPDNQANTWNGVTPGYSSLQDAISKFGEPTGTKQTANGTATVFEAFDYSAPHEVITDQSGTITFMKEYLPYDPENILQSYIEQYGQPDLSLYNHTGNPGNLNHVFLKEGLVVVAHEEENVVFERWYFEPTDQATFLQSWGQSLEEERHGPHLILTR